MIGLAEAEARMIEIRARLDAGECFPPELMAAECREIIAAFYVDWLERTLAAR